MQASQAPTNIPVRAASPKITRGHSCILCQQRKVKCDKQKPCSNCIKAHADCVPSQPTQPRRRKRKLTETDLADRLKRYEHLLRKHGVKIEDDEAEVEEVPEPEQKHPLRDDFLAIRHHPHPHHGRPRRPETGALFANKENSHYVENTLWENLRDEIQAPEALPNSSDEELNEPSTFPHPENLLLNSGATTKDLNSYHPPPVHIFRLWQVFLDNVNPLTKLFHAPTVQQMILDATADLTKIPKHVESLMFSIYLLAVGSLGNEECETLFGESRQTLLAKYSYGAQQSLINARFLKSLNIVTLQSLVLYIIGARNVYDPYSLWILTGAAVRISQRLGLHRDGASHHISPFEAEIRRRTWWAVVYQDGHSSKLAGAGFPAWLAKFDTKPPLNISDSDLSPGMKEPPTEKEGATEMLFCCLRYETAQTLRRSKHLKRHGGHGHGPGGPGHGPGPGHGHGSIPGGPGGLNGHCGPVWEVATGTALLEEKDRAINELEARFQEKFLRHCDPSIPLHFLCIFLAKSVISIMRIMAHHPRQYPDKGASMPQSEKDMLFAESLKQIEYDALGHNTKEIKGFQWHIVSHFQLDAFIYLLSELQHRTTGEQVDRAWQQVKFAFDNRPEMLVGSKNSLYTAIGNLALKSWKKREEVVGTLHDPPQFIIKLREQRKIPNPQPAPQPQTESSHPASNAQIYGMPTMGNELWNNAEFTFESDMLMPEITPVDWEYWQTLIDLPAYQGGNLGINMGESQQNWYS